MKFIFDFDDVLFYKTKLKEKIFFTFEKFGIERNLMEEYLEKERQNLFSLKKMLAYFSIQENVYEEIMSECKNFTNKELLKIVKDLAKKNCFIITYGDKEFQQDKIKKTNIASLFFKITIVSGSKKEAVENICAKHINEEVVFIDDKAHNFKDLDFKKYPNLKTILYDEQGLQKIISIIP